ncbi:MAG: ion transporter [Deltaproteobacteria bacterium]|nr:ion transporter [Deltaproteobacteria bacterium]
MVSESSPPDPLPSLRSRLREIIFEADTPAGKAFDVILIWCIAISISVVVVNSVATIHQTYGRWLEAVEWFFTLLFTLEYLLRLFCVQRPLRYAVSFFGIVDLLAILPTYVGFMVPGGKSLMTIRLLRVLRIFRVLKLSQYLSEARLLMTALKASRRKISVFLLAVVAIVVIIGSVMYIIEGDAHGFSDIPTSIYWAIVTLTTVGYGDISPQTPLGKALASLVMIMGYGIIAVPTGIVGAEIAQVGKRPPTTKVCRACAAQGHDSDAVYCKFCGARLGSGTDFKKINMNGAEKSKTKPDFLES